MQLKRKQKAWETTGTKERLQGLFKRDTGHRKLPNGNLGSHSMETQMRNTVQKYFVYLIYIRDKYAGHE
jgi:hypothetical protein